MPGMLVFFHCESNPGFAIAKHEVTFFRLAERLVGTPERIHFAYPTLKDGLSPALSGLRNVIEFDARSRDEVALRRVSDYVRDNGITMGLGFDQSLRRPSNRWLRYGGMRRMVSYLGAPMSSLNGGLKLAAKRAEVWLDRHKPDHFVFQSEGMRETAVRGRGIPEHMTSLVRSGIDTDRFVPPAGPSWYAHDVFGIPRTRKIVFFSGHMEQRKGVHVLLKAVRRLVESHRRTDVHALILGNRNGQEKRFAELYEGAESAAHITFGGYRDDVPAILQSCAMGVVASTGWDSFPMSSIEMAASGLPVIVSDLIGLREAVTDQTGLRFPVADDAALASCVLKLLDDDARRHDMGIAGRLRAVTEFSVDAQLEGMEAVFRRVAADVL